jgi:TPR repeat protein
MYQKGRGVPEDLVQAYLWFELAGLDGQSDGDTERDRLAPAMTPDQIAQAQQLAKAWKPKPAR